MNVGQVTLSQVIVLTREIVQKLHNKPSLKQLHENVKHFWIFRGISAYFVTLKTAKLPFENPEGNYFFSFKE